MSSGASSDPHVPRPRKSAAWELQHTSSVKVSGRVREVIPLSFRELHIVIDCSAAALQSKTEAKMEAAAKGISVEEQEAERQKQKRNWVDVHVLDTWATRCGLLVEGDLVELTSFGVFRPASAATLAVINSGASSSSQQQQQHASSSASSPDKNVSAATAAASNSPGDPLNARYSKSASAAYVEHKKALFATSVDSSVQFWVLPSSRASKCPFILAPVAQSTFVVERGRRLLMHDNTTASAAGGGHGGDQQNDPASSSTSDLNDPAANKKNNQSEIELRGVGSRTPQQLFIQSMKLAQQRTGDNNNDDDGADGKNGEKPKQQLSADQPQPNSGALSMTTATSATGDASSVGSGVGKNLFANCFRFIDVMRGLNSNLVPLLKKIQRSCAGVQHILDAGCGSGHIAFALKCADPGPEIVATDRSRAMSALVQEKNQTFAGLINRKLLNKAQQQQRQQQQQHPAGSASAASGGCGGSSSSSSSDAPLVQFVIGDLSASPERFVILPAGTNPTEVAVGGRKQFDALLCIDVLSYLPSMEAMKRALFNLVLHAKPHAKLLLSVPNLSSCAEDAAKLTSASTLNAASSASSSGNNAGAAAAAFLDPETRPKVQRSLHYKYDRHALSLGCSVHLSHGGLLDVVERQWYDILTTTSTVGNIKVGNPSPGASMRGAGSASMNSANNENESNSDADSNNNAEHGGSSMKQASSSGGGGGGSRSNLTRDDGVRKVLRRHTEWFGFSCPNPQHASQQQQQQHGGAATVDAASFTGGGSSGSSPQIFYEQMEELILHPTVLECMFGDMGWHVEEVWLFNALERGGEGASANLNTMAVLGAVPGSESPGKNAPPSSSDPPQSLESRFSHRLYTLTRKI